MHVEQSYLLLFVALSLQIRKLLHSFWRQTVTLNPQALVFIYNQQISLEK
jgi:hypothetical protein